MLEFLRKHQYGFMLVVAILVIIAFVFLYDKNTYSQGNVQRGTAFKVYGKGYGANYLQKLDSYYMLAGRLGMLDLADQLAGKRIKDGGLPLDFPTNLLILRKEARKLGISPSNEEARKELESLRIFADDTGRFDPTTFAAISKTLSDSNFKDADLMQIARDKITLDRVKELLSANFQPPVTEVEDVYASGNEEITAYALNRSLDDFLKEVTISDEEIAERYEEEKENLMSEEQRKFEYVHFQAPIFPKPSPPTPTPAAPLDLGGAKPGNDPTSLIQPKKPVTIPTPVSETEPKTESEAEAEADGNSATEALESGDEPVGEEAESAEATAPEPSAVTEEGAEAEADVDAEGDACGSPQDEPVSEDEPAFVENAEENAERVEEITAEVEEAAGDTETEEAAAGAATSLAEDLAETIKAGAETAAPVPAATSGAADPASAVTPAPVVPELTPAQKKEANTKFMAAVKEQYDATRDSEGEIDLEKLGAAFIAAAAGEKFSGTYGATELFTRDDVPAFLENAGPADEARRRNPLDVIFAGKEGALSNPEKFAIDDRVDYFIFRVTEIVEPNQLTLEEAKEQITETLKDEKAHAALEAALKEDAEKIKTEMAGENSFKVSADKLGIEYARHYKFVGRPKPEELGNYFGYSDLVTSTVPGTFSEPKIAGTTGYIVYVAAKDLADDPAANNKKLTISDQLRDGVKYQSYTVREGYGDQIFQAWLDHAVEKAEPSRKY